MCEITLLHHGFYAEGKYREETSTNLQSNPIVCVKFPIRTGTAWDPLILEGCAQLRDVYRGWNDHDDDVEFQSEDIYFF